MEPETETIPVELVELETVGQRPGGRTPRVVAAVALVVGAALAAVLLLSRPSSVTPQPTWSAPVATALPSAVAVIPTVLPTPSARPTPIPTAPPPWQWTSEGFGSDLQQTPGDDGAWGVGDRVLVSTYLPNTELDSLGLAMTRVTADETRAFVVPPAIERLTGGTAIGNGVSFLARVSGVAPARTRLQLVSTADGETWHSFGDAQGLDAAGGASFVGRLGGTWVVGAWRATDGGAGAPTPADLMWSGDGARWQAATVPTLPGTVYFDRAGMLGKTMVVLAYGWVDFDHITTAILLSDDGKTWRKVPMPLPVGTSIHDLVCGERGCVLMADEDDAEGSSTRSLWLSTDGTSWTDVDIGLSAVEAAQIDNVVATSTGFMATASLASAVLLSNDGRSWWQVKVLPPARAGSFRYLVSAQDLVVGIDDVLGLIWRGSLASMEAAPH